MRDIVVHALDEIVSKAVKGAIQDIVEDAYLAGIFDGEGSVFRDEGRWRVAVVNTYYHTLERFKERFGGSITERQRAKEHHKMAWSWSGSGHSARRMAKALLPFLEIKRDLVEEADGDNWGLTVTELLD